MMYFSTQKLMSPPTDHPAFSDRRAYMCAELAKSAYFKLEGGESNTLIQTLEVAKKRGIISDDVLRQLNVLLSTMTIPDSIEQAKHVFRKENHGIS